MNIPRTIFALSHLWLALAVTSLAVLWSAFATEPVSEVPAAYPDIAAVDSTTNTEVGNRVPDPTPAADVTRFFGQVTLGQPERTTSSSSQPKVAVFKLFGDASDERTRFSGQLSQRSAQVLFCTWVV